MAEENIHLEESKLLLDSLVEHPERFEEFHANEIARILKEIYNRRAWKTS